jgi:hypothetical protein
LLVLAPAAQADPIGPDCDTCQGGIYTLSYDGSPISTTATTETFRITLSVDASGYGGAATHLEEAAVKVSSSIVSASIVSGPGMVPWWMVMGGIDESGCDGSGSGFDCVGLGSGGVELDAMPTFGFTFDIEVLTGGLFTGPFESSIKARYTDGMGHKIGAIVSENITLQAIPEPSTALLIGTGLLLAAAARRRV